MRKLLFIFVLLVSCFTFIVGQTLSDFPKGIGIDLEIGHNEINWETDYYRTSGNELNVSLNGKLFYKFNVLNEFYLEPFIGFMQFGGAIPEQANGYMEEINMDAVQMGFLILYNTNFFNIDIGLGFKAKKLNSAIIRRFGEFEDQEGPREWVNTDIKPLLESFSYNIGLRVALTYDYIRFGIESWIGLKDFKNDEIAEEVELGGGTLTENHYRFIIGFVLK